MLPLGKVRPESTTILACDAGQFLGQHDRFGRVAGVFPVDVEQVDRDSARRCAQHWPLRAGQRARGAGYAFRRRLGRVQLFLSSLTSLSCFFGGGAQRQYLLGKTEQALLHGQSTFALRQRQTGKSGVPAWHGSFHARATPRDLSRSLGAISEIWRQ